MGGIVKIPKAFLVVFLLCFLIRVVFFLAIRPWDPAVVDDKILQTDAKGYHELALNLIEYHNFKYDGILDVYRPPLYPLFIACHYAIFGVHPWIVLFVQVLINVATCALLFVILKEAINADVAVYASLFFALDPFFILYSSYLFSDVLFVFLNVIAAYFFTKAILKNFNNEYRHIALSALFFGFAALTKPVEQYIPVIIVMILLMLNRRMIRRAFVPCGMFAVIFFLVISPWMIRNYVKYGSFSLSTSASYNLLISHVDAMEMERRQQSSHPKIKSDLYQEAKILMVKDGLNPDDLNGFEMAVYWKKLALQYIKSDPISFLKHYLLGIFRTFANLVTSGYADMLQFTDHQTTFEIRAYPNIFDLIQQWIKNKSGEEIVLGVFIGLFLMISYICLIIGLIVAWADSRRDFLFFCTVIALYFLLVTGTAGLARFKLPIIPFYLCFVGAGANWCVGTVKNLSISAFKKEV